MGQTKITTIGSVVAAIVASLCCIGPVAVAFIGVGSIGVFAVFESFRPYVIGLTAMLLGLAFYLAYRKREVKCEDGSCTIESAGKWNNLSVWLATFAASAAIAFPYLNITSTQAANTSVLPAASVVLRIDGMDCRACAAGLQATLAKLEGVHKATVEYEQSKGVIDYDPGKVQSGRFLEVIDEAGFEASVAEAGASNTTPGYSPH